MRQFTTLLLLLGLLSACDASRQEANSTKAAQMEELIVQPVGGFAGAGGPGHVKSEGRISMSALSPEDRAKVESLFSHPQPSPGNFYYRITRQGSAGTRSVNVPMDAVPAALTASVKTVIE